MVENQLLYRGIKDSKVISAPAEIPQDLMKQLKIGGRMIIPVGRFTQQLFYIEKNGRDKFLITALAYVKFVPMIK